jgi:hypothetical protein
MSNVMTMLDAAQGGKLFANIAASLDLDEAQTRKAMGKLCPAIAKKLKERAAEDEDLFASLTALSADGAETTPLEEPEAMSDAEAIEDGNAILEDVYGSRNGAMVALRKVTDVPERELSKLAPISATAVVAALAQANRPMTLAAGEQQPQAASSGIGGEGVLGTLIGAVIAGAVSGVMRELTSSRRWRGTTSYTKTRSKRKASTAAKPKSKSKKTTKTASRRSTTSASVEDIFRDILGKL